MIYKIIFLTKFSSNKVKNQYTPFPACFLPLGPKALRGITIKKAGGRPARRAAGRALLHVSRFLKKYLSYDHEILHTLRVPLEDVLRIFW